MSTREPSSDARFPKWSFAAVAAVTLVTLAILARGSWDSMDVVLQFEERELAIERVCGEIIHLDEVLTMSALVSATTGNLAWEQRYQDHVILLDAAIAEARRLAPGAEESEGTEQTDAANQHLIALELAAFELVRGGDLQAAQALLMGEEYRQQKAIYSAGTQRYLAAMRARVSSILELERERAERDRLVLLASVPLLFGLWGAVGRSIRGHVRKRREYAERLKEHARALERNNEEVRASSRAKAEFLARMSHEIRTPMHGVLGFAELLSDRTLDAEQAEAVHVIQSSGALLLSIIDDILDFSKIEAGKLRIRPVPCDPARIAREVIQVLQPKAVAQKIELRCDLAADLPRAVLVDPLRLRQILMNLIGNAVKFTERGSVVVSLAARPLADHPAGRDACELRLSVSDTGVGIAAEHLKHVFEGFVQADDSIGQRFGGTGLGLAICRELARLMGGAIEVESELGRGSRFSVTLPVRSAAPDESVPPHVADPALRFDARVLVVEDNAVNRAVARRMIERLGCRADEATNGEEGLRALASAAYDLVFMDCNMPVLDGFEATRAIRAREDAGERTPIVALTASAFPGDVEACRKAGMDDFLSKPFSVEELRAVLARWLGERCRAA